MDPIRQALQAEAERRGMGQAPSSAGVGAPAAQAPAGQNPLAARGMIAPQQQPNQTPAMPSAGDPFAGASQMMNGAAHQGGTMIEKALIKRMHMYPPA